jgi:hypothetical protein
MTTRPRKHLTGKQVAARVFRRLRKYDKLNFLESFAMFMGKVQVVELGLKNLLINKYGLEDEQIEQWPLGRVIAELERRGCRKDFIELLKDLKDRRNHIAHELLANDAIIRKLTGFSPTFPARSVSKGLFSVEQVIVVHDFLISNGFL